MIFPAVTLFLKGLDRRLNAPDHPFNVDVVDFIDNLRGNGLDRRGWRHAGVVDDDVEAAQRFARLFDGGKYRSRSETSTFTAMARPPAWLISEATALAVASL